MAVSELTLARRLLGAIECGEVEVTPDEMHYLMGLDDGGFTDLIIEAAKTLNVLIPPSFMPTSVRVKVRR